MRTIIKDQHPLCLDHQPACQDWDDFNRNQSACYRQVGEVLRKEQAYLCCCCDSKIDKDKSLIEHLVPRSIKPRLIYDYSNLAVSCNGGADANRHCGHYRGNGYDAARFSSPHDPATARLFRYLSDGSVIPVNGLDGNGQAKANYMIELLNLNCPLLKGRRHSHAQGLIGTLGEAPDDEILQWAGDCYLRPDANGALHEFFSVSREVLAR
ncbi:MAG: TIGR02646 family protein [Deltaproteobacteria bacterium]|nr:TIGR02646 family protein [Deltaproteobacteria bacterium]